MEVGDEADFNQMADLLLFLQAEVDHSLDRIEEVVAQHNSEAAQFGDSWPGAQMQISDAFDSIRKGCQRINHYRQAFGLDPTFTVHLPNYWRG